LQLWNESCGEAHMILCKNWEYPKLGFSGSFFAVGSVPLLAECMSVSKHLFVPIACVTTRLW